VIMNDVDPLWVRAVVRDVPAPRQAFQLPSVNRIWIDSRSQLFPDKVVRHPNLFDDVLPDVRETYQTRRSRSASRGWQAKLPSRKLQRTVRARSLLEQRAFERCEVDGDIIRYCEQPITITYFDRAGVRRKHTPDLYYETATIRSFVEVKWEADARKAKNEIRWPAIAAAINALGFRYEVLTERHILRKPTADNVGELLRFRRAEPLSDPLKHSIRAVLRQGPLSVEEILSLLPGIHSSGVYRGLVEGWISTNLDFPLSGQSLLRLPNAPGRRL
jgi:hypothetical protein